MATVAVHTHIIAYSIRIVKSLTASLTPDLATSRTTPANVWPSPQAIRLLPSAYASRAGVLVPVGESG